MNFGRRTSRCTNVDIDGGVVLSLMVSKTFTNLTNTVRTLNAFKCTTVGNKFAKMKFSNVTITLLNNGNPVKVVFTTLLFKDLGINTLGVPLRTKIPGRLISVVVTLVIFFITTDCVVHVFVSHVDGGKIGWINLVRVLLVVVPSALL